MRPRLLRPLLIVGLLGGGVVAYRSTMRPEPTRLAAWADAALADLFGPGVSHGEVRVDLIDGVRIRGLRVPGPDPDGEPALAADEIDIRHDLLALSAGVPRLASIVLRRPHLTAHETEDGGVALDVPFDPPGDDGSRAAPLPSIEVLDGVFRLRAHPASTTLRAGAVVECAAVRIVALAGPDGVFRVEGGFVPSGLGLGKGEEVSLWGRGDPTARTFEVHALWDRLRLTPAVRALLAPALLERIDAQRLEEGPHRLTVHLERDPAVEEGRIRVRPEFRGVSKMDIGSFPGAETIDAVTREQINELFGKIDLSLELSGNRIDIREVTTSLAGGEVRASGKIEDGGEVVDVDLRVAGLRLDDPALWKALGATGDLIRDEFVIQGTADAAVSLRRARGEAFRWEAVIDLVDATLVYKGRLAPGELTPSGKPMRMGFPWAAEHCFGRIVLTPSEVRVEGIEGRHGGAPIRIRSARELSRTGGPTGFVRFGGGDTELVLTIETSNVPVDRDLEEAVEGSEFAGFLDRYRPDGTIDRLVLDIEKRAHLDGAAVVSLDLDLGGDRFRYAAFPLPMTDVSGRVSLVRPVRPDGRRGKEFHVRAKGRAAGGDIVVEADLLESDRRGRTRVVGRGVTIEGPLEDAAFESTAIAGGLGETWEFLRPTGVVDVVADLPAFDDPAPESWDVRFHDATIHLGPEGDDRDVPVEGLNGPLRVVGGVATLAGIRGRIGEGTVVAQGTLEAGTRGRWDLAVDATDLRLSRGLLRAMDDAAPGAGALPAGLALEPGGRLDLAVRLRREPVAKGRAPVTADVSVRRADLAARVGALPVRVRGGFDVRGKDVRLEELTIEGRGIRIRVPRAKVGDAGLEGSLHATLVDLEVSKELLGFLPESLRASFADATKDRRLDAKDLRADVDARGAMTITGTLGLRARPGAPAGGAPRGELEFAPIRVGPEGAAKARTLDGLLRLRALTLDVGTRLEEVSGALDVASLRLGDDPEGAATLRIDTARVAGLAVERMTVPLAWRAGILRSEAFEGAVYGGRLAGRIAVHTRAPVALEGSVRVDDLRLEALVADVGRGKPDVRGRVAVEAEFQSRSGSFADFTAAGTIAIRDGDLGDLPAVANLPALLASVLPFAKTPKFERADVAFTIEQEAFVADRLVLGGPLFSMEGFGTLDFRGALDATLTPQFLKSLLLPGSTEIPGIREVAGLFREDSLYVVRVRGPVASARPTLVPFPLLGPRRDGPAEFQGTPFLGTPSRRIPRWFR